MNNFGQVTAPKRTYTAAEIAERQQLYQTLPTPAGEINIYMIALISFIGIAAIVMLMGD